MSIESAKYMISELTELKTIKAKINNQELIVPLDSDNTDYQAILEWVAKGNTIEDAD